MNGQDKKSAFQPPPTSPGVAGSQSPWILKQQGRTLSRATTKASSIPNGAYVTATGRSNTLYRIQNGSRQLVLPTELESLGITQNDIQEVDALVLRSIPLSDARRAIGRNLQKYLWSDLGANHHMQSWVWLQGTTLTVRTQTETGTWFGGYTGGVSVVLSDAGGKRIQHDEIRFRYGIDGRAFGSGWREDTEPVELPQDVANAAESITILHYWDPKVDLVGNIISAAVFIWDLIQKILEAEQEGESVNAGGEDF